MHSYLKSREGYQVASEYCPLDLFSGDETRIVKAIHALLGGWISSNATANNLKIFARGKFLKPSEVSFCYLYIDFLLDSVIDSFLIPTFRRI
jgi:inositol-pentakisphosphate 2-kinase